MIIHLYTNIYIRLKPTGSCCLLKLRSLLRSMCFASVELSIHSVVLIYYIKIFLNKQKNACLSYINYNFAARYKFIEISLLWQNCLRVMPIRR